jgi:hypothetical protein
MARDEFASSAVTRLYRVAFLMVGRLKSHRLCPRMTRQVPDELIDGLSRPVVGVPDEHGRGHLRRLTHALILPDAAPEDPPHIGTSARPAAAAARARHTEVMAVFFDYFSAGSDEQAASVIDRRGGPGRAFAALTAQDSGRRGLFRRKTSGWSGPATDTPE